MMTSTTCGSELQPSSLDRCHSYPSSLHRHRHHHQPLLRRCNSDSNFLLPPPRPQTNTFLSAGHSPDLNQPNETTSSPSPTHFNSSLPPLPPPQKPPTGDRSVSDLNPSPAPTDTDAASSTEMSVETDSDTPNSKQPPALRCSVSDLNPSPAQAFSRSSSSNEMSVETDTDTPNSKRLKRMKGGQKEVMCEEDLELDVELKIGATQDMPDIDGSQDILNDTSTVAQGTPCLKVDEMGEGSSKQLHFDGEEKKVDGGLKEMMSEEDLEHDVELKIGATQDMPDIDGSQDIPNDTSTVAHGSSYLKVDEMGEGSSKQLNFDEEEKKVDGGLKEMMSEDLEHDVELKIRATQDMSDIDGSQDIPNDTSTVAHGSSYLKVDEMGEGSSKQLNFDGEEKKVHEVGESDMTNYGDLASSAPRTVDVIPVSSKRSLEANGVKNSNSESIRLRPLREDLNTPSFHVSDSPFYSDKGSSAGFHAEGHHDYDEGSSAAMDPTNPQFISLLEELKRNSIVIKTLSDTTRRYERKIAEQDEQIKELSAKTDVKEGLAEWLVFLTRFILEIFLTAMEHRVKKHKVVAICIASFVLFLNLIEIVMSYKRRPWVVNRWIRLSNMPWATLFPGLVVASLEIWFYASTFKVEDPIHLSLLPCAYNVFYILNSIIWSPKTVIFGQKVLCFLRSIGVLRQRHVGILGVGALRGRWSKVPVP